MKKTILYLIVLLAVASGVLYYVKNRPEPQDFFPQIEQPLEINRQPLPEPKPDPKPEQPEIKPQPIPPSPPKPEPKQKLRDRLDSLKDKLK